MNFDEAFAAVIGHEGGYVHDKHDPGGQTNFGISQRAYPDEDIAGMTLDRAKIIYKRDYWDQCQCDQLPAALRFHVFDAAVNSGVRQSVRWLQRAVGATPDGVLGAKTILAARIRDPYQSIAKFCGARLAFMAALPTWSRFGRGWARRVAANLMET